MFSHSIVRLGFCLAFLSIVSVNAFFFDSLAGVATDIVKSPLESLSLFALKSYLLGHLGGRVTQYRQMMYNANRPNGAPVYQEGQYYTNVHNRPRRSVEDVEDLEDQEQQQQEGSITAEQFLEIAEKLDVDKCIPRLVCEVMSGSDVTEGGQFKDLVVKVFGEEEPEINGNQKMFQSIYHYAAFTGKQTEDVDHCHELFPKCKASDSEFGKMAKKIFASVDGLDQ